MRTSCYALWHGEAIEELSTRKEPAKSRYQCMAGFQFYNLVRWLDRPTQPNFFLKIIHVDQPAAGGAFRTELDQTRAIDSLPRALTRSYQNVCWTYQSRQLPQADRRKGVEDFKRRIEASLDKANFIDDGESELVNLYLQDIDNDFNSGVRHDNDETTPNPVYGDMNTDGCQGWHDNIR
jgi:hypothetical protein